MSPKCYACGGLGKKDCQVCKGTGKITGKSGSGDQKSKKKLICTACRGTGQINCSVCGGSGRR